MSSGCAGGLGCAIGLGMANGARAGVGAGAGVGCGKRGKRRWLGLFAGNPGGICARSSKPVTAKTSASRKVFIV